MLVFDLRQSTSFRLCLSSKHLVKLMVTTLMIAIVANTQDPSMDEENERIEQVVNIDWSHNMDAVNMLNGIDLNWNRYKGKRTTRRARKDFKKLPVFDPPAQSHDSIPDSQKEYPKSQLEIDIHDYLHPPSDDESVDLEGYTSSSSVDSKNSNSNDGNVDEYPHPDDDDDDDDEEFWNNKSNGYIITDQKPTNPTDPDDSTKKNNNRWINLLTLSGKFVELNLDTVNFYTFQRRTSRSVEDTEKLDEYSFDSDYSDIDNDSDSDDEDPGSPNLNYYNELGFDSDNESEYDDNVQEGPICEWSAHPSNESLTKCKAHFNGRVAIVSHGFWGSSDSGVMLDLREELQNHYDTIIMVDWRTHALKVNYYSAAQLTRAVGHLLGELLLVLEDSKGLDFDKVHLMGYSLGAHISSFACQHVTRYSQKKIALLTGFDPARPLFPWGVGISRSDARIVQIIHSGLSLFGTSEQRGHIDFYPNGGSNHPECKDSNALTLQKQSCDHAYAIKLFTKMLEKKRTSEKECQFVGYPCASHDRYSKGRCKECVVIGVDHCREITDHIIAPAVEESALRNLTFTTSNSNDMCGANYHIQLILDDTVPRTAKSAFQVRFRMSNGEKLEANIESTDLQTLIVGEQGPSLVQHARIFSSGREMVQSIKLTYLSHTDAKIRAKYSRTLTLYRKSSQGFLYIAEPTINSKSSDMLNQSYMRSNKFSQYKMRKYGLQTLV